MVPPHVARVHSQLKLSAEIIAYVHPSRKQDFTDFVLKIKTVEGRKSSDCRGVPALVYLDLWGPSC